MKDNFGLDIGKVHKLELYIIDPNCTYESAMDIFNEIYNKLYDGVPTVFNSSTTEVFWYDNIDINMNNATKDDFEKYFSDKKE